MGTQYYSRDLNVSVTGRVISETESGETEGVVFELADGPDAVQIKHPQLVTITTRPESQTLRSINTGEPLLTLETPLLPSKPESKQGDDDGDEHDQEPKSTTQRKVILHAGLVPATRIDPAAVQKSPLFSQSFSILIDAPNFPPPHFDPSSLAPPTPSFRAVDQNSSSFPGILNSPTLQRALLSPLLSPQRRAASQGSDMSVPPLSLGLSRTSRTSFSADNRPLRPGSTLPPSGLLALVPSLAPSQQSSGQSSTNAAASPSVSAVPQTPPTVASDPHSLASTLTASISGSAKKTAEDILSLRRNHDSFVRRAKAELEVLEARIESVRNGGAGGGVVGGGGVVRGFGVPVLVRKDAESGAARGTSGSRERGRSTGRGGERSPLGGNTDARKDSPSTQARRDRDEDVSSHMRELDQREEDERGRSRSRQRRRDDPRSLSRTKKIAEATEAAAKGAKEKERRTDSSREREGGSGDVSIPATTADGDDDDDGEEVNSHSTLRPPAGSSGGGNSPSFLPSTSTTTGLVAIPEAEELSLGPSESSRTLSPGKERQRTATDQEEDAPFEMDEDVDVDFLELSSSRPIFQQQPPDFGTFEASDAMRSPVLQPSTSTFRPGSLQRASSLSASYAALLSSSKATPTSQQRPHSPSVPVQDRPMATSAQEDINTRNSSSNAAPDPRDVREGEQKIRDVLAIDVPSHRRALPRKSQKTDRDESDTRTDSNSASDTEEDEDTLRELASPSNKFQVGSVPIPLAHRPSSRAMSSWRPDPEREWALEREKRSAGGGGTNRSSWVPPSLSPDDQASTPLAVPLEIGGGSTSSQGTTRQAGASSLAQSLRNAPVGSFSARAGRETAPPNEQLHLPDGDSGHEGPVTGGEEEEEEEEEDGVFLPPHLVSDRRARKDEKYLSRSVSRS